MSPIPTMYDPDIHILMEIKYTFILYEIYIYIELLQGNIIRTCLL